MHRWFLAIRATVVLAVELVVVICMITPQSLRAQTLTVLHNFTGATNGGNPSPGLAATANAGSSMAPPSQAEGDHAQMNMEATIADLLQHGLLKGSFVPLRPLSNGQDTDESQRGTSQFPYCRPTGDELVGARLRVSRS